MIRSARQPQAEAVPDTGLSRYIGYTLKRVVSLVQSDLALALGPFGLRAVSFSALVIVVHNPGINQTRLADVLKIERSNLVQLIDELSARGLLVRTPVVGDRRRHALMATTAGKTLAASAADAVAEHERRVFAMLDADERDRLLGLLHKVRTDWPA